MQWTLVQKGQTHTVDTVNIGSGNFVFSVKRSNVPTHGIGCSMQWMQYTVCSGCSGIVVYGDGDIVSDAKRSNQWMR